VVGVTSVGSGSLIIVILVALYPMLRPNDLVGTDLVQAVPLVAAAALGHLFFGDIHLDVAASLVLGARLSSRAPAGIVRVALVVVLLGSAVKLFGLPGQVVLAVTAAATAAGVIVLRRNRRTGESGRGGLVATPPVPLDDGPPDGEAEGLPVPTAVAAQRQIHLR